MEHFHHKLTRLPMAMVRSKVGEPHCAWFTKRSITYMCRPAKLRLSIIIIIQRVSRLRHGPVVEGNFVTQSWWQCSFRSSSTDFRQEDVMCAICTPTHPNTPMLLCPVPPPHTRPHLTTANNSLLQCSMTHIHDDLNFLNNNILYIYI